MSHLYQTFIQEFMISKGLEYSDHALGLEFECDETGVLIMQHPLHHDQVLIEATVAPMNRLQQAQVAPLLLQLNEEARFEHAWSVVMDMEGQVFLWSSFALQGALLSQLEEYIAEGVERARVLSNMLNLLADETASGSIQDEALGQTVLVRG